MSKHHVGSCSSFGTGGWCKWFEQLSLLGGRSRCSALPGWPKYLLSTEQGCDRLRAPSCGCCAPFREGWYGGTMGTMQGMRPVFKILNWFALMKSTISYWSVQYSVCGYLNILNKIFSSESVLLKDFHSVPSSGFHSVIQIALHQNQI